MTEKQLTIMAVHAHPDDESSSTGGILARYAAEGHRTVLVTCTGGELGEIADPALAQPENLRDVRRGELAEACRILQVSQLHMLGYRDSGMAGLPENEHPASFHQAELFEAVGRLVKLVRAERPKVLVTYDENGFYGHPDHIRANQITVGAWDAAGDPDRYAELGEPWTPLKLYYQTIPRSSLRTFAEKMREAGLEPPVRTEKEPAIGSPDEMVTTTVDVTPWVATKRAALMAHRTQMGADVFFTRLSPELFSVLFGTERFIRAAARVDVPEKENDLLVGL